MTMQRFTVVGGDWDLVPCDAPEPKGLYKVADVAVHVDELNAEIEQAQLDWDIAAADVRKLTKERDTLRDILKLLVPDLKLMAAAAQAMGNHARAQALNNICKGVDL